MLTISAMALMLVFSIGSRATETGFRLGRDALGQADRSVAIDSLRTIIDGFMVTPSGIRPDVLRIPAVEGAADRLSGDVILTRSTLCAPAGPARDLTLEIRPLDGGSQVLCAVGQGEPVVMFATDTPIAFAYSEDGTVWSAAWSNADEAETGETDEFGALLRDRTLLVRLAADDGRFELIAAARTGRPQLFTSRLRDIEL